MLNLRMDQQELATSIVLWAKLVFIKKSLVCLFMDVIVTVAEYCAHSLVSDHLIQHMTVIAVVKNMQYSYFALL